MLRHLRRCSRSDHLAAFVAAFGAEVDDPVRRADDVEVVLDDGDGVAVAGEAVEDVEEFVDVGGVEAGGGFVGEVELLAVSAEDFGKLHHVCP